MIELAIEDKICSMLAPLLPRDVSISGTWSPMRVEQATAPCAVVVSAAPREYVNFGLPPITIALTITAVVRLDLFPSSVDLLCAPIADFLRRLNAANKCADLGCIAVEGMYPNAVEVAGGAAPTIDYTSNTWAAQFGARIYGTLI